MLTPQQHPLLCAAIVLALGTICTSASAAGDAASGKAKALACGGCHGANGIAVAPNFPNLAGQNATYLVNAISAYQTGKRNDPTMNAMVAALSPADVADLAAYYSSLPKK